MYKSHVISVMDYSSRIWGYSKSEEGDNIQNRATIYYLGVHQNAPIVAIQGYSGRTRIKIRHQVAIQKLRNRLSDMSEDCLTKIVFSWDYNVCKHVSYEYVISLICNRYTSQNLYVT